MTWYATGSITVTNESKIITGIGTQWANPLMGVSAGRMLILQTQTLIEIYEIASVQSDTQLTLAENYEGTTAKNRAYKIPTSPTVSIEQLALEISATLGYYQKQMEGWQSILTGDGEVTLTAPNGQTVTIKSQYAISKELIDIANGAKEFATQASTSASNASKSEKASKESEDSAKGYSESASTSAQSADSSKAASALSEENAGKSADASKTSEKNSKTNEENAARYADAAKTSAESIDTSSFVKKSGDAMTGDLIINGTLALKQGDGGFFGITPNLANRTNILSDEVCNKTQFFYLGDANSSSTYLNGPLKDSFLVAYDGVLSVKTGQTGQNSWRKLSFLEYHDNTGIKYFSIAQYNKSTNTWSFLKEWAMQSASNIAIGEFKLFPFRVAELPFGWYCRNGDKFPLRSEQGIVLNSLSDNYKQDHSIVSTKSLINVPNAFSSDGRGYFERASRQVGALQGDAMRYLDGWFLSFGGLGNDNNNMCVETNRFNFDVAGSALNNSLKAHWVSFQNNRANNPVDIENRPINMGLTPAIYLGV